MLHFPPIMVFNMLLIHFGTVSCLSAMDFSCSGRPITDQLEILGLSGSTLDLMEM